MCVRCCCPEFADEGVGARADGWEPEMELGWREVVMSKSGSGRWC